MRLCGPRPLFRIRGPVPGPRAGHRRSRRIGSRRLLASVWVSMPRRCVCTVDTAISHVCVECQAVEPYPIAVSDEGDITTFNAAAKRRFCHAEVLGCLGNGHVARSRDDRIGHRIASLTRFGIFRNGIADCRRAEVGVHAAQRASPSTPRRRASECETHAGRPGKEAQSTAILRFKIRARRTSAGCRRVLRGG